MRTNFVNLKNKADTGASGLFFIPPVNISGAHFRLGMVKNVLEAGDVKGKIWPTDVTERQFFDWVSTPYSIEDKDKVLKVSSAEQDTYTYHPIIQEVSSSLRMEKVHQGGGWYFELLHLRDELDGGRFNASDLLEMMYLGFPPAFEPVSLITKYGYGRSHLSELKDLVVTHPNIEIIGEQKNVLGIKA